MFKCLACGRNSDLTEALHQGPSGRYSIKTKCGFCHTAAEYRHWPVTNGEKAFINKTFGIVIEGRYSYGILQCPYCGGVKTPSPNGRVKHDGKEKQLLKCRDCKENFVKPGLK